MIAGASAQGLTSGVPWPVFLAAPMCAQLVVHKGFKAAYDSVAQQVAMEVRAQVARDTTGPWTIYMTGHSLGGALATVCAYHLAR